MVDGRQVFSCNNNHYVTTFIVSMSDQLSFNICRYYMCSMCNHTCTGYIVWMWHCVYFYDLFIISLQLEKLSTYGKAACHDATKKLIMFNHILEFSAILWFLNCLHRITSHCWPLFTPIIIALLPGHYLCPWTTRVIGPPPLTTNIITHVTLYISLC